MIKKIKGRSSITLVLGGISSGKSEYAEQIVKNMHEDSPEEFFYFTPAGCPEDDEMKAKVAAHKARRPDWLETIECGTAPADALSKLKKSSKVLLDSAGSLLGRMMMDGFSSEEAYDEINSVISKSREKNIDIVIVSEEVGMELVALSSSGRIFQKTMGRINQLIANSADHVLFITAGIPQKLK